MTFSKKVGEQTNPQQGQSGGFSDEQKKEWNNYIFSCFKAKEKELPKGKVRKEKQLIGVVNFIMDLGTPPSADNEWETKCALPEEGEDYSKEELEWKDKNPTHDFIWTNSWDDTLKKSVRTRKQTSPSYPAQEFGVAVDFPQILVDYSKHPSSVSDVEDLRPYRISLNGNFHYKFNKPIVFDGSYKPVSENNIIYKICTASGKDKELVESKFDIGVVAGATCNFTVRLDLNEGMYLNTNISKPSAVEDIDIGGIEMSSEDQINSVLKDAPLAPFVGILLNGQDYTEDMFKMLGSDTFGFVKRASLSKTYNISGISKAGKPYSFDKGVDYDGSDFQKAWDVYKGEQPSKESNPIPEEKPIQKPVEVPQYDEPPMDFDDDVPF